MNGLGSDSEHNGIGIGFIGNTGPGHDSQNQIYQFFNKLYINPLNNLGKVFRETRIADISGDNPINLNFLGDPELPVWTGDFDDLSINYNPGTLPLDKIHWKLLSTKGCQMKNKPLCVYIKKTKYMV